MHLEPCSAEHPYSDTVIKSPALLEECSAKCTYKQVWRPSHQTCKYLLYFILGCGYGEVMHAHVPTLHLTLYKERVCPFVVNMVEQLGIFLNPECDSFTESHHHVCIVLQIAY